LDSDYLGHGQPSPRSPTDVGLALLQQSERVLGRGNDESRPIQDSRQSFFLAQAVDLRDIWIEAESLQIVAESAPIRVDPAATANIKKGKAASRQSRGYVLREIEVITKTLHAILQPPSCLPCLIRRS